MKTVQLIRNILACCVVLFVSNTAIAAKFQGIACPTVEEISQFTYGAAFPYGFDKRSHQAKFLVGAEQTENHTTSMNGDWFLAIYPVAARQSDDLQSLSQSVIERLVPVTSTAFQFNMIDDIELPFCAYALPGHDDVTAMAYYINDGYDDGDDDDNDDEFSAKLKSKVNHHRQRMMKLMQHAKQMFLK